uniref:Uncharacterized protein n=1 Tax=Ixodes ricinus TaxID=34613 RepID=A0A6B0URI3_IXORI
MSVREVYTLKKKVPVVTPFRVYLACPWSLSQKVAKLPLPLGSKFYTLSQGAPCSLGETTLSLMGSNILSFKGVILLPLRSNRAYFWIEGSTLFENDSTCFKGVTSPLLRGNNSQPVYTLSGATSMLLEY